MAQPGLSAVAFALLAATSTAVQLRRDAGSDADALSHLAGMKPEVVARLLTQVEHKWESTAVSDLRHKSDSKVSLASMVDSCSKVTKGIVAGSDGDKDRVVAYLR